MNNPSQTRTIKMANLREIAAGRMIRELTLIAHPGGGFILEAEIGTGKRVVAPARRNTPRVFASIDRACSVIRELGLLQFRVDLTQHHDHHP